MYTYRKKNTDRHNILLQFCYPNANINTFISIFEIYYFTVVDTCHYTIYWSKSIEYTTLRMTPNEHYGLWEIMVCHEGS